MSQVSNMNMPIETARIEQRHQRIGDTLLAHAKLKVEDIERVLLLQSEKNILFGEAARALGLISNQELNAVLAEQFGYAYINSANHQISQRLFMAIDPFGAKAEQMRALRGQLLLNWFDNGHKTLAVTSVADEDEASQLVANLAVAFSQLNKNTLLIDANLRRPKQQGLFGIDKKEGLSNVLANREGRYELTRTKNLPNLSILTSGTAAPNPQELIAQHSFLRLLNDLENIYDLILIDTAPAQYGIDFLHVANYAGAAMIVSRKHHTPLSALKSHCDQLNDVRVQLVGGVVHAG